MVSHAHSIADYTTLLLDMNALKTIQGIIYTWLFTSRSFCLGSNKEIVMYMCVFLSFYLTTKHFGALVAP